MEDKVTPESPSTICIPSISRQKLGTRLFQTPEVQSQMVVVATVCSLSMERSTFTVDGTPSNNTITFGNSTSRRTNGLSQISTTVLQDGTTHHALCQPSQLGNSSFSVVKNSNTMKVLREDSETTLIQVATWILEPLHGPLMHLTKKSIPIFHRQENMPQ